MNIYTSDKKAVFAALTDKAHCDVLVIGGGASGILCAYKLQKKGLKVVLAEKDLVASKKTSYNCGMLFGIGSPSCDGKTAEDMKMYSTSFSELKEIATTVGDNTFRDTKALYYTENFSQTAFSKMRQEYRMRFFSGEKCSFLTWKDAMKLYSFNIASGILTNSAAQHNPVNFCEKAADYLSLKGVEIYENTEITGVCRSNEDKKFTSTALNGSTVISSAVIDCRGSSEICIQEKHDAHMKTVYYLTTEPVKNLTGWYCGSIITDDCKMPLFLRTDEKNRIIMTLWSGNILRKFGGIYDDYMFRYQEKLLCSMFFGIKNIKIESRGKFDCRLPRNNICGAREDDSLKGFFYICSGNTTGLQDAERMAEKTSESVFNYLNKTNL